MMLPLRLRTGRGKWFLQFTSDIINHFYQQKKMCHPLGGLEQHPGVAVIMGGRDLSFAMVVLIRFNLKNHLTNMF